MLPSPAASITGNIHTTVVHNWWNTDMLYAEVHGLH